MYKKREALLSRLDVTRPILPEQVCKVALFRVGWQIADKDAHCSTLYRAVHPIHSHSVLFLVSLCI